MEQVHVLPLDRRWNYSPVLASDILIDKWFANITPDAYFVSDSKDYYVFRDRAGRYLIMAHPNSNEFYQSEHTIPRLRAVALAENYSEVVEYMLSVDAVTVHP